LAQRHILEHKYKIQTWVHMQANTRYANPTLDICPFPCIETAITVPAKNSCEILEISG